MTTTYWKHARLGYKSVPRFMTFVLPMGCVVLSAWFAVSFAGSIACAADGAPASSPLALPPASSVDSHTQVRAAAVALNYSRASLHRIRQNPSYRVMFEEQEKILNHLNLNGIADEEVLKLYTSVLDEVGQMRIADREYEVLKDKYNRALRQELTLDSLTIFTQLATAQFGQAVRSGANSWWDFRNLGHNRDLDQWKVEKSRMTAVFDKSSQFLDTSWKMARAKQIPDRWLVRGDDLNRLEAAWKEHDLATRLRVLKRMEGFMEAYPPYWYYVARTQQSMGQLFAAGETYAKLAEMGSGHFRKDDMLAAGLANRAAIQAYLGQPGAVATARAALEYSTDVWEANLLCAAVLERDGEYQLAEDAILRNVDVGLERPQSAAALVGLYCRSEQPGPLAVCLTDMNFVRELPPYALLTGLVHLRDRPIPTAAMAKLASTLQVAPRYNFNKDDLVVSLAPAWQAHRAAISLRVGEVIYQEPRYVAHNQSLTANFEGIAEFGSPISSSASEIGPVVLTFQYPDLPPMQLTLEPQSSEQGQPGYSPGRPIGGDVVLTGKRSPSYRLTGVQQGATKVELRAGLESRASDVVQTSVRNAVELQTPSSVTADAAHELPGLVVPHRQVD